MLTTAADTENGSTASPAGKPHRQTDRQTKWLESNLCFVLCACVHDDARVSTWRSCRLTPVFIATHTSQEQQQHHWYTKTQTHIPVVRKLVSLPASETQLPVNPDTEAGSEIQA